MAAGRQAQMYAVALQLSLGRASVSGGEGLQSSSQGEPPLYSKTMIIQRGKQTNNTTTQRYSPTQDTRCHYGQNRSRDV
jgi:hypothetical protein